MEVVACTEGAAVVGLAVVGVTVGLEVEGIWVSTAVVGATVGSKLMDGSAVGLRVGQIVGLRDGILVEGFWVEGGCVGMVVGDNVGRSGQLTENFAEELVAPRIASFAQENLFCPPISSIPY